MGPYLAILGIELGDGIVSGGLGAPADGGGPPPAQPTGGPFKLRAVTSRKRKLRLKVVLS